jgi:magnesium-transporting ATPase (P-type)
MVGAGVVSLMRFDTGISYPPTSPVDKIIFAVNVLMLIGIVGLYAGLKWNKDYPPPQTHPLATMAFWKSMLGFVLTAFAVTLSLSLVGVRIFPYSFGTAQGSNHALVLVVLVVMAMLRLKGNPQLLGLGSGLGIYLLISFCSM